MQAVEAAAGKQEQMAPQGLAVLVETDIYPHSPEYRHIMQAVVEVVRICLEV
jgi:sulfur carrier protein ThiS